MDSSPTALSDTTTRRLQESRILFLGTEVTDEAANELCGQLLLLDSLDPVRDIYLYVNSPGGSVSAGMAIYDTMRLVRPDVATVAVGFAASMGQFLVSSGTPGKRFALPHSRIVMHQPWGGFGGTSADIQIQAAQIVATKHEMARITAEQTGRTVEQILADGDRDRWFTADEARDYGLVDAVISHPSDLVPSGAAAASRN